MKQAISSAPTAGTTWKPSASKTCLTNPNAPDAAPTRLGMLKVEEEKALPLIEKKDHLAKDEEKMQLRAKQTAELIEKYGKAAAVALSATRVLHRCLQRSCEGAYSFLIVLRVSYGSRT